MADLTEAIARVKERIRNYRSLYEQNEMATRNQVVDPILRALGWDTEDPAKVQPNVATEEGVPDYTLFLDGRKVLFIEAKKMSVDVGDQRVLSQLARYCFGEGMSYGLLTNGVVWILFRAFQEGTTMSERVVWRADLEHDNMDTLVRKLDTVSTENVGTIDRLLKKLGILDEVWQSLLDDPKTLAKGIAPLFQTLTKDAHPDFELSLEEIEDFVRERLNEVLSEVGEPSAGEDGGDNPPSPRTMRIGRDSFPIRNWYEVLVNTAEWLIRKGKLQKEQCPVVSGHKRYLVNTEPKHRYGDAFRAPRKLSNGLYIETHYSASGCIFNARKLLEHCGFSGSELEVTGSEQP